MIDVLIIGKNGQLGWELQHTLPVLGNLIKTDYPELDLLIRYLEYLEWFERRPDKIKHLDYVLSHSDEIQRERLFENAHRYILYHHTRWQRKVPAKRSRGKSPLNKFWKLVYKTQKRLGIYNKC